MNHPTKHFIIFWLAVIVVFTNVSEGFGQSSHPSAARTETLANLRDIYTNMVAKTYKEIVRVAPTGDRKILENLKPEITLDDLAFGFFADGGDYENRPRIIATVGGLRSVQQIGMAHLIAAEQFHDGRWFIDYCLYLRANLTKGAVDPLEAAGLKYEDLSTETVQRVFVHQAICTTFILAHEGGHVCWGHNSIRPPGETEGLYLLRRRNQEKAADEAAMRSLRRMKQIPSAVASLFLSWMLAMEGTHSPVAGGTHPADHQRTRLLAKFTLDNLDDFDLQEHDPNEIRAIFQNLLQFCDNFDEPGFVAELEARGKVITAAKLRKGNWKPASP